MSRGSFGNLDESLLGDETLVAYAAAAGTTAADGTGRNSPYTSALLSYLEQPLEIGLLFREVRARVLEATGGEQRPHEYASLLGEHYLRAATGADPRAVEASLGLDRAGRRRMQEGLTRAGFSPGPADGVFGPATRAALRGWQTSRGATATGYLDAAGATALGVPVASPAAGAAAVPRAAPTATATAAAAPTAAASVATAELTRAETVFWESMRESTRASGFEAYLARWPSGIYAPLATSRLATLREAASTRPAVDPTRSPEAGEEFQDCPACPEMVVLPGGEFLMGSDRRDDESHDRERPRHRVTVGGFAMGVHEVTRDEYAAFVAATGRGSGDRCWAMNDDDRWEWRDDASWRSPGYSQAGDHPVVCVNWEDAQAYVAWLSEETGEEYRLPSESEWEYAARAGTTTRWHWGNDPDDGCAYANGADGTAKRRFDGWTVADCTDGVVWTSLVGAYRANAFGLHDMLGNVWEWVEDCWHDDYDGAPRDRSPWTRGGDCSRRGLRGGSWGNRPRNLRSAIRNWTDAENRGAADGFRVARTLN